VQAQLVLQALQSAAPQWALTGADVSAIMMMDRRMRMSYENELTRA